MKFTISEDTFEAALQIIQHAVCHFTPENLWEILYADRNYHGNSHDEKYISKKYEEFQANPLRFFMSLDITERPVLFEAAKKSLNEALA